jgi:L-asparagine transporter-like permease
MYFLLCVAVLVGRFSGRTAHAPYQMPFFPLAPMVGIAALVYILYANWIDLAVGRPSLIATVVMLAAAGLYYALLRWRRGPDWRMVRPAE